MAKNERNYKKTEKEIQTLPKSIKTKKERKKEKESKIANEFKKYFTNVGTAFANKIPITKFNVIEYLLHCNALIEYKELWFQEIVNIHINRISTKISKSIGMLYRARLKIARK